MLRGVRARSFSVRQRPPGLVALPLSLALAALFGPILFSGKALFWGTPLLQFVPWWSYAWQTLLAGHLPLWNPLVGMGAPLLANYQTGLLYPPNWLYFLLYLLRGAAGVAWGQALLVSLHLAWAGSGMAILARRLGLGSLAQAVSGLSFGLCAYLVGRSGFLSINATAAWLPWVMLFLTPEAESSLTFKRQAGAWRVEKRFLGLTACLALQLLAGHAQTAWYTLLLAGLWSGFLALFRVSKRPALRRLLEAWLFLGLALLLALSLAAIQLLPTLEYLGQSQRAQAVDYQLAMTYSFWPWRLLDLVAPGLFGSPVQGDYWGYANYWEDAIYLGMLPFLLALGMLLGGLWVGVRKSFSAAFAAIRRWPAGDVPDASERVQLTLLPGAGRLAAFLVFLLALALAWGLGQNTPIFPWLYRHVPTFDLFQAPTRIMLLAEFSLALLAGLGAERWRRPQGRGLYWTRLGTAGALAVGLGAGLAWYLLGTGAPEEGGLKLSFIRATALAGFWGIGSGVLSLTAPPAESQDAPQTEPTKRRWQLAYSLAAWRWGVVLFIAADLALAGWGMNPAQDLSLYQAGPIVQLPAAGRLYFPSAVEYALKYERFLRFNTFSPGFDWLGARRLQLANVNLLDQVASVNNFDPLVPGNYQAWMEELDRLSPADRERRLRLMGAGVVVTLQEQAPLGALFDPLLEGGQRLYWMPCAHPATSPEQAWKLLGQVDLQREVILEGSALPAGPECLGETPPGPAGLTFLEDSPNRVQIQVDSRSPGYLVLSDAWYPGWQAQVNGQATTLWRADTLFRAVYLPAGVAQVTFAYRPLSFYAGAALSLLSLFLLGLLARRGAQPPQPAPGEGSPAA